MGERHPNELPYCLEYRLQVSTGDLRLLRQLDQLAHRSGLVIPFHLKVNTGMNRYGVRWDEVESVAEEIKRELHGLLLEGVMSHFSMSDETDKSFAHEQTDRFGQALQGLTKLGIQPGIRHLCNTGGFLDLPTAHFDMVRLGILPTGVYPSAVCRRISGLQPVMSVKARIVAQRDLAPGDIYGYGLRYRASTPRRIAVLPLGYGDGYPRLRNSGQVLVHGQPAPILGGVAMDAIGIDLTDIPRAALWDEAVLLGEQGQASLSARDIAAWAQTVCYDILAGWRHRLPRIFVNDDRASAHPC
jgi:alanine racemase